MAIKRGSKIDMGNSAASMTDLMFLLLIFLMIATTLINSNAIDLTPPKSTSPSKETATVIVSINSKLQYFVDDNEVDFAQLESVVAAKMSGAEERVITLSADKSVPFDNVVQVMNVAKRLGTKFLVTTNPE